jgi:3-dehydroquinate synthase
VLVPTTLIAQVDVSVGGRTQVDHPRQDGLIGTFYQPRLVWIDPDTLATLPAREIRAGLVEIVKLAAIWDARLFEWLEANAEAVRRLERDPLCELLGRAVGIKAELVGLDEREAGLRSLLAIGAPLARALAPGRVDGRHKAMGLAIAARLSTACGMLPADELARLEALLSRLGLPLAPPDWDEQKLAYLRAVGDDKSSGGRGAGRVPVVEDAVDGVPEVENTAEKLSMVLLRELGRAELATLSPADLAAAAR